jgi:hypothetical protein
MSVEYKPGDPVEWYGWRARGDGLALHRGIVDSIQLKGVLVRRGRKGRGRVVFVSYTDMRRHGSGGDPNLG